MHHPSISHTLVIFEQLFHQLPPLVHPSIRHDMGQALEQVRHNNKLTLEELEDTMIVFGKQVWPYRQAFREFVEVYEGKMGEQFLRQVVSPALRKRFDAFAAHGGGFRDLYAGGPFGFFSAEERVSLGEAMVMVRQTVREHVAQAVVSTEKREYEGRIYEFHQILDDIEKRLDTLRLMADNEQEHPELAAEIREGVRTFEYGLCSLGPHLDFESLHKAPDHFVGRKKDKQHHIVL